MSNGKSLTRNALQISHMLGQSYHKEQHDAPYYQIGKTATRTGGTIRITAKLLLCVTDATCVEYQACG